MKKRIIGIIAIVFMLVCATSVFVGCDTQANRVNYNITEEAENFNVYRRVTVINCIKGDTLFEIEGRMNLVLQNKLLPIEKLPKKNRSEKRKKNFVKSKKKNIREIITMNIFSAKLMPERNLPKANFVNCVGSLMRLKLYTEKTAVGRGL